MTPGYSLSKIINQLKQEQGTASNIKSTTTRKNVTTALERMIQHLRLFDELPENGLALFSGNVSDREGFDDFQVYSIIPPMPIPTKVYICEQRFFIEPLEEMTRPHDVIGLLVIERGGATVGLLKGRTVETLQDVKSLVPGKFKAGGQSSVRFERVRENLTNDFYKIVAKRMNELFTDMAGLKWILIGGAGPAKDAFVSGDFLRPELQKKIIAVKDVGSDGDAGVRELVSRSMDELAGEEIAKEKKLVNDFLARLAKNEPAAYGEDEVRKAIGYNAVETLLISEKLEKYRVSAVCATCKKTQDFTVDNLDVFTKELRQKPCPCGGTMQVASVKDVIEELAEAAAKSGAGVELISTETSEGEQLFEFGGVAALLRFKIT